MIFLFLMRHALADLEGVGGYGGCNPFENSKVKKKVIKQNKKTEEMKREKEK